MQFRAQRARQRARLGLDRHDVLLVREVDPRFDQRQERCEFLGHRSGTGRPSAFGSMPARRRASTRLHGDHRRDPRPVRAVSLPAR